MKTPISTFTGQQFNPTAQDIGDLIKHINMEDISSGLGRMCRFNGQTIKFYSVAQHSMIVAALVPPQYRALALLHDAAEAYLGDVIKPLKMLLPYYAELEKRVEEAIFTCFGLKMDDAAHAAIKKADYIALATEKRDLMPRSESQEWDYLVGVSPLPGTIEPMAPEVAKSRFKEMYAQLCINEGNPSWSISLEDAMASHEPEPAPPLTLASVADYLAMQPDQLAQNIKVIREHTERAQSHLRSEFKAAVATKSWRDLYNAFERGYTPTAADMRLLVKADFGLFDAVRQATNRSKAGGSRYWAAIACAVEEERVDTLRLLLNPPADIKSACSPNVVIGFWQIAEGVVGSPSKEFHAEVFNMLLEQALEQEPILADTWVPRLLDAAIALGNHQAIACLNAHGQLRSVQIARSALRHAIHQQSFDCAILIARAVLDPQQELEVLGKNWEWFTKQAFSGIPPEVLEQMTAPMGQVTAGMDR